MAGQMKKTFLFPHSSLEEIHVCVEFLIGGWGGVGWDVYLN